MKITGSCSICVRIHFDQLMNAPLEAAIAASLCPRCARWHSNSDRGEVAAAGTLIAGSHERDVDDRLSAARALLRPRTHTQQHSMRKKVDSRVRTLVENARSQLKPVVATFVPLGGC